MVKVILPWQNPFEQFRVSRSSPRQYRPPVLGAGLVQVLRRWWKHSGLHEDHEDQSDHPPSIPGMWKNKWVNLNNYQIQSKQILKLEKQFSSLLIEQNCTKPNIYCSNWRQRRKNLNKENVEMSFFIYDLKLF